MQYEVLDFETFSRYTDRRLATPPEDIIRRFDWLKQEYSFPPGRVGYCHGFRIDMTATTQTSLFHIRREQLAKLPYGPDEQHAGKGPAHIFALVEVVWGTVRDVNSADSCKRAWVIVQFQRQRKLATVWDFCPDLDILGRVTSWALHSKGAFSNYSSHHRNAKTDIPAVNGGILDRRSSALCSTGSNFTGSPPFTRDWQTALVPCPSGFTFNKKRSRELRQMRGVNE